MRLQSALRRLDEERTAGGSLGVWVADLDNGLTVGHRAEERWYLASMVKVPVAVALLRGVDAGRYGLDTMLTLRQGDVVDGGGATKRQAVGTRLRVDELLEQMIVWSDNTATDMLIDLVGLDAVNAVAGELSGGGMGPITRLVDVRRHVYGGIDERARLLSGTDFLELRDQAGDAARLRRLASMVGAPAGAFRDRSLGAAYSRYYAGGLNSGRLDAYGRLLAAIATGDALPPTRQRHLMAVMRRVQTGHRRLRAGLPSCLPFAEKTGTQRARICDAGILNVPPADASAERRLVVVACVRDVPSTTQAEHVLREVGAALTASGALDDIRLPTPACAAP